jgi:cardiolipin synthase
MQRYNYLLVALTSIIFTACSSTNTISYLSTHQDSSVKKPSLLDSFVEPDQNDRLSRSTSAVESGAGLAGKTLLVDPLVRPVSTIKALLGITLKSITGYVDRGFLGQFRLRDLEGDAVPPLANAEAMDLVAWEQELDSLTSRPVSSGEIGFLVDGEAYFERLTSAIETAQESIDIRTYIFDNDDVALDIADLLRQKSEEVEVRIMVDGLADLFASRQDSHSLPAATELPASMSRYLTYESKVRFRKQSNPWFTGDHVKLTLIDDDQAFVGGMNIGREYRYDWHDLMMEVSGPIVSQLQYEFDQSWAKAGVFGDFAWFAGALKRPPVAHSEGSYPIRILSTSIHNSELYRAQVAAIRRSRQRIFIENTYFSDDRILFELVAARRRGVDVRVVLASKGDSNMLDLSNQIAINTMLRNGIRVFRYPGMTHVKAAVYDGWACLGSANFDKLSLQVNHEINLGTSHPETVQKLLTQVFYPDFDQSEELLEALPLATRHYIAEWIADGFY